MNMFEEAKSIAVMMKMRSMSQSQAAKMLGVSQSFVANKLRLLNFDENERQTILDNGLTERHARSILRLKDSRERKEALKIVCQRKLTVSGTEALVDYIRMGEAPKEIGNSVGLTYIDKFIRSIKESVKVLSSLGVNATEKTSYSKSKTFITIIINE